MSVSRAPVSECLRLNSLYPFALRWFASVPAEERASMRVLDMPAGSGVLSVPLSAAGFDVTPADLFPEYLAKSIGGPSGETAAAYFTRHTEGTPMPADVERALFPNGAPAVDTSMTATAADMEARMPFEDGSFDVILCVEGIEHVLNRHAVLEEFRRLLKPGGKLVMTTPNLLSTRARLAYAFAGQRAFKSFIDEHSSVWGRSDDGSRLYHGHAFLVNYFQVRYSLHHCGFRLTELLRSNWSTTSVLNAWMVPFIALATKRSQRKAKRLFPRKKEDGRIPQDAVEPFDEIYRHVLSGELLYNATLMTVSEAV